MPRKAVISSQATTLEAITVVNHNVGKVLSFSTSNATLSGDGFFNLKGEIIFRRPGLFRLRGSHAVSGAELDIGRNSEVSWLWVQKADPKVTYYCPNADYAACQYIQSLPIDPSWMIEALGLGEIDPNVAYDGPTAVDDKHLELRRRETTAAGVERTKVYVINRYYGLPAAIRVYDKYQSIVADARVRSWRTDPQTGITIPQSVEIRCPKENEGQGVTFHIHLGTPSLNTLSSSDASPWSMPQYPGYPAKNLATMTPN